MGTCPLAPLHVLIALRCSCSYTVGGGTHLAEQQAAGGRMACVKHWATRFLVQRMRSCAPCSHWATTWGLWNMTKAVQPYIQGTKTQTAFVASFAKIQWAYGRTELRSSRPKAKGRGLSGASPRLNTRCHVRTVLGTAKDRRLHVMHVAGRTDRVYGTLVRHGCVA